ncbi:MAG: FecR family protein [Parabacteroides sp.]
MLNILEEKYIQNKLTAEELKQLRHEVQQLSDESISTRMQARWMADDIDTSDVPVSRLDQIKKRIDASSFSSISYSWLRRTAQIAAAITIPVLIITSFYLYRENKNLGTNEMIVSTNIGERANITLPDGTHVTLNAESKLKYAPQTFNKSERLIHFEGEAYFDVKKNHDIPFLIRTTDVQIKVVGTKFNLSARDKNPVAELVLEEGKVLFTSLSSKECRAISPNQKVIFDKKTGTITITTINAQSISSWRKGDLVFHNAQFADIIHTIESNYGVSIDIASHSDIQKDLFSGTVPSNNISEAMEIISKAYHLTPTIVDKKVTLSECN